MHKMYSKFCTCSHGIPNDFKNVLQSWYSIKLLLFYFFLDAGVNIGDIIGTAMAVIIIIIGVSTILLVVLLVKIKRRPMPHRSVESRPESGHNVVSVSTQKMTRYR